MPVPTPTSRMRPPCGPQMRSVLAVLRHRPAVTLVGVEMALDQGQRRGEFVGHLGHERPFFLAPLADVAQGGVESRGHFGDFVLWPAVLHLTGIAGIDSPCLPGQ